MIISFKGISKEGFLFNGYVKIINASLRFILKLGSH